MAKLRDRIWIWGHPAGAHNGQWGFAGQSRMTVSEAAYYMGARNALMVGYGNKPVPPFDKEAIAMDPLREVIWSIVGDASCDNNVEKMGYLDEVLDITKEHPNIKGAIFDDFFVDGRQDVYTPEVLSKVASKLHSAPNGRIDMWTVLYDRQLYDDVQAHIDQFDGITFWTWEQDKLVNFDKNLARMKEICKGKRVLLGCYLYDYGNRMEMTKDNIAYQLDRYSEEIKNGEAEGMILLSNTVCDLKFEAVEYAKEWLFIHGDDSVPE